MMKSKMSIEKWPRGDYNMTDWKELYSTELQNNMRLKTENIRLNNKISELIDVMLKTPNDSKLGYEIRQLIKLLQ